MKPAPFEFQRPRTLREALDWLAAAQGEARVLAGGQSLIPLMNLRAARPDVLIDIAALPELRRSRQFDDYLEIGAATTHANIEDIAVPDVSRGFLPAVATRIAYRGVRNRGTVGGSLAHMFPGADWPVVFLAMGAEVEATNARGKRSFPIDELGRDALTTTLEPDEILTAVRIPIFSASARWAYFKFARKAGELAHAQCAIALDFERGLSRVAMGGRLGPPFLLDPAIAAVAAPDLAACESALASHLPDLPETTPAERRIYAGTLLRALEQLIS